jgi:predicted PurR-regulated permease PerM
MNADSQRQSRLVRALLIASLVLVCAAILGIVAEVLGHVHNTVVVLILAVLFSYVVYPPVRWLAARRVPVGLGGLIVYAALFMLISAAIAWLTPAIASQANELTQNYPKLVAQAQLQLADPAHSPILGRLPNGLRSTIAANTGKAAAIAGTVAGAFGTHTLEIVTGTTAALANLGLMLGITLLMISELGDIQAFTLRLVPPDHRHFAASFMDDVDSIVGAFVRGQLLMALSVAVAGTLLLMVVGIPYAILLGLLAGILSIVPIVGPIAAFLPVVLIAFFTVGLTKTIIVAIFFGIIIGVQQNVLVPILIARSVGISPLAIFVALLLGSEAFGILGALLAIPIAGVLRVCAERIFPPLRPDENIPAASLEEKVSSTPT